MLLMLLRRAATKRQSQGRYVCLHKSFALDLHVTSKSFALDLHVTASYRRVPNTASDWLGNKRGLPFGGHGPPSKIRMGSQRAIAGGGTSKFGSGTGKANHAIIFFSLTQVLQIFATSSCPRCFYHQFSHCSYFSIFYFSTQHLVYFFLLFPIDFSHSRLDGHKFSWPV